MFSSFSCLGGKSPPALYAIAFGLAQTLAQNFMSNASLASHTTSPNGIFERPYMEDLWLQQMETIFRRNVKDISEESGPPNLSLLPDCFLGTATMLILSTGSP